MIFRCRFLAQTRQTGRQQVGPRLYIKIIIFPLSGSADVPNYGGSHTVDRFPAFLLNFHLDSSIALPVSDRYNHHLVDWGDSRV